MADWLPLRTDIWDDPAVLSISATLGMDPDTVIGKLARMWAWFSKHTTRGRTSALNFGQLDALVGAQGFAEAVKVSGWLFDDNGELVIPNFRRWNTQTAKERALAQRRMQRYRARQGRNGGVTRTVPREDDITTDERTREKTKTAHGAAAFAPCSGETAASRPVAGDDRETERGKCITLLQRVGIHGAQAIKLANRADCDAGRIYDVLRAAAWLSQRGKLTRKPAAYVTWAINSLDWSPPGDMA